MELWQGDCLELMKNIPDKSIDMVLCDLPYNETGAKWDKKFDLKSLFDEYRRIIKPNGCIALNGTFKFGVQLYNMAPDLYKYDWVWEKDNGTNVPNVNFQPFRVHEFIFIFGMGGCSHGSKTTMKYNPQKTHGKPYMAHTGSVSELWKGTMYKVTTNNKSGLRHPKTVQKFKRDRGLHPTQKPISMCEYFVKTYTNVGDTVLDNCMGSGSTGVACVNTGRNFIGIELDENYFNIAKQRIENAQKSLDIHD